MGLLVVEIKQRSDMPRKEYVLQALRKALHVLDVQQDMIGAWSGLVSDLLKHPETQHHPIIWEGTKKITDIRVFTIDGLRTLIEKTCKTEMEG